MLQYLKKESEKTFTENGAVTYNTTKSECLDLFFQIGALRNKNDYEIYKIFERAYIQDPNIAMKILFFARDIRNGLGERRTFRICLKNLATDYPKSIRRNLLYISEYGRFDDLLVLFNTSCENDVLLLINNQLKQDNIDMENNRPISLLAKWLPSINTSSKTSVENAKKIAKYLKISFKDYRIMLSKMRKYIDIIEDRLRQKDYTFEYDKQPSKALFKYRKAFLRNDEQRYQTFIYNVINGTSTLHTASLYPYDIIRSAMTSNISCEEIKTLDASWNSMSKHLDNQNALAVVDGSGSMYWTPSNNIRPCDVAISLGLYFALNNTGEFANHFITFSKTPRLIEIKGNNIVEKARYVSKYNEVADTNIEAVFDLILSTALKNKLPQSELPSTLYIISDMEFNYCAKNADITNFENAKNKYNEAGYILPNIIFWNVNSRTEQFPVQMHETGTALVSGSSPKIFEMVQSGDISPIKIMNDTINNERYEIISA